MEFQHYGGLMDVPGGSDPRSAENGCFLDKGARQIRAIILCPETIKLEYC